MAGSDARRTIRFGVHDVEPAVADRMNDPLVRRARRATPEAVDFLRWSILPMATIAKTACRARVSFGDARFGLPRVSARFVQSVDLPLRGRLPTNAAVAR